MSQGSHLAAVARRTAVTASLIICRNGTTCCPTGFVVTSPRACVTEGCDPTSCGCQTGGGRVTDARDGKCGSTIIHIRQRHSVFAVAARRARRAGHLICGVRAMTTEATKLTTAPVTWSTKSVEPQLLMSVRYWSQHSADTRMMRDQSIIEARESGASVSDIARAAGMSRQAVTKLLARNLPESVDN